MTKLVEKFEGDGCYCRYFNEEEPREPKCTKFGRRLRWNVSGRVLKCEECLKEGMPTKMQARRQFMLNEVGPNKIAVIKAVRETTDLGLKEAYDLVTIVQSMHDPQEVPIRKSMEHKDALALFRAVGATVEFKVKWDRSTRSTYPIGPATMTLTKRELLVLLKLVLDYYDMGGTK